MMRSDSLTLVSIFLSIVDDIERRTVYVERLLQIAVHAAENGGHDFVGKTTADFVGWRSELNSVIYC